MKYNSKAENAIDVMFTNLDPCLWVVYPQGSGGDLLSSILHFHYDQTGARFCGITDTGKALFCPSDNKDSNLTYLNGSDLQLNQHFIDSTNRVLSEKYLSYGVLDQMMFSNHLWTDAQVNNILDFFPKATIVRILPRTNLEQQIILWLAAYKNKNLLLDLNLPENITEITLTNIANPRVLNIYFGDLLKPETFETAYDSILKHLNLPYKLIRHDFISYWISQQHDTIRPALQAV